MLTDITSWTEVSSRTKDACVNATLNHTQTYYANVIAYNRGLNPKRIAASSNGGKPKHLSFCYLLVSMQMR